MSSADRRIQPGTFLLLRRLRAPLTLLILVYAVAIFGMTLMPGVDSAGRPWKMGFFHAFYFVSFLGTTIGLGEIPYPFSDAQRLWASLSIYSTVVVWLWGIGELLSTMQDPLFRRIVHESRVARAVRRIREPFVLVCGYGDAGALVTRELTADGMRVVVVDSDRARVDAVEVDELPLPVPALHANSVEPGALMRAGITHPHCIGTLALTGDDAVNLTVTLNAKLLAPAHRAVCVAHHHEHQAAMARVGADHLINPHDTFADRLAFAITTPSLHVIYEALTMQAATPMLPVRQIPRGRWIVCGFGRFGRTVRRRLDETGIAVTVVAEPGHAEAADDIVIGNLLDAGVLRAAGIEHADGVMVSIANDTLALAITTLARELNPRIYTVVRQSERRNTPLFRALAPDMSTLSGYIVAAEVLRVLRAPQLSYFLRLARAHDEAWAEALLARMRERIGDEIAESWSMTVDASGAPALAQALARGIEVRLGDLLRGRDESGNALAVVTLLVQREGGKLLLPDGDARLAAGDRVLFCGRIRERGRLDWIVHDRKVLAGVLAACRAERDRLMHAGG